ncbi:MAG: pseudouridine-5'-phosphate glycosidase, partial [Candidatus Cloacimonetes bacterium]|nr:pseudouridine-5'-phosphate glycosidase [Candidatus Cloacimonadota bacterium]
MKTAVSMKEEVFPLLFSDRVSQAQKNGTPLLALESTVLTHGLPYPRNLEVLSHLEGVCRNCGAEPATIIVLDGAVHIGMN